MEAELEMIEKNNTWQLVERPFNKPVIGVKWVYKTKLNLDDCKAVATPLAMNERLSKIDGSEAANEGEYRQIVGSLLYLTATRPDMNL
ncbi:hypothetical protein L3X38_032690 [Prunus dulcis]|uniref:Reverse transcriptase Ty1/copia-type domain-containing protein n=1 Tax=Prunus dulcis TaxID=3755 RepID=A0AAD4YWV7_PRUDU|nr:hypothetical protein L3X38_032690 [Prunus dulcis]